MHNQKEQADRTASRHLNRPQVGGAERLQRAADDGDVISGLFLKAFRPYFGIDAPSQVGPSVKPAVCRWRLSRTEAERLAVVAGGKGMPPGDWCVRTLRHALDRAERQVGPPPDLAPRSPGGGDVREFLNPISGLFFTNKPPLAAQMRELLEVWEDYRAGRLVRVL